MQWCHLVYSDLPTNANRIPFKLKYGVRSLSFRLCEHSNLSIRSLSFLDLLHDRLQVILLIKL